MARALSKEEVVGVRVYTAFFIDSEKPSVPGFDRIKMGKFKMLVPIGLTADDPKRRRRIAIVDDAVRTGWSFKELVMYLRKKGYARANIRTACCVCYQGVKEVHRQEPDISHFRPVSLNFAMPWGNSFSFESCFEKGSEI